MKSRGLKISIFISLSLVLATLILRAGDIHRLDSSVKFNKTKESVYYFLQHISKQSGYMFIYDSNLIDNNKVVQISKKENTIAAIIDEIIDSNNIEIEVRDSYILFLPKKVENSYKDIANSKRVVNHKIIRGTIYDSKTKEPVSYCSIGIKNSTIGTVTNNEGEFQIIVSNSLLNEQLIIGRIGYKKEEINISVCTDKNLDFYLEPYAISLSEAVVSIVDPYKLLDSMRINIPDNYPVDATYITGFYREGIDYKEKHTDLTESVLKIYNSDYKKNRGENQAKILRMRRIKDSTMSDSLRAIVKLQSGISTCFMLDLIKYTPDFIEKPKIDSNPYEYHYIGVSNIDDRKVYIVSFQQKEYISRPLYVGELYIDAENFALVEAKFSINPKHTKEATSIYIVRHHRNIKIELKKAEYIVSYKKSIDDRYFINYIRGNIEFNLKNKKWFFNTNTPIGVWFALTNCHIEKDNVKRFPRDERVIPQRIFSDNQYVYDPDFWELFNFVLPETELKKLIQENINEILEIED